jgi:hypothetical protein
MQLPTGSMTDPETIHSEFRMDPGLRRSCWYVLAAIPVLVAVGTYVGTHVERPNREGAAAMMIALAGGFALWMVIALSWRLRIDEEGICRRILWFWSRWTWEDFASGRIQKKSGGEFYDPERRRSLKIGYLPRDVLPLAIDRINRSYTAPSAPPILSGLQFGKRFPFQPRGRMDADGIELESKDGSIRFDWSDVIRLRFVRSDPLARHYRTATLELPGSTITWAKAMSPVTQSSDGQFCTEEQINDFLLSQIPPEKVVVDREGMRPQCRRDIIERLQQLDRSHAELGKCLTICGVVFIAMLACLIYEKGLASGLLSGAFFAVGLLAFLVPIYWSVEREQHQIRTQLSCWLKELDELEMVNGQRTDDSTSCL